MSTRGPWDIRAERGLRVEATHHGSAAGPTLHHARSAWLTYEPFYGLKEQPFSLASNPTFFHQSGSHASTFQALLAGIRRRERLSVLTGDIGTGKTTLCRAVLENLDRETFSAFVADPFASREDLLKVLLMEFGVMSLDDLTSGRLRTASRTELSYLLYDFLGKLAPLQAFAVVIIDEAQNLSLPVLEEIRILSDFDGRDRQLQVVLVGQLELRQKLKLAEMRQVDQRVSVRCHLEPLSHEGIAGYIAHRLRVAGAAADRVSFSADACDVVFQASKGVPRVINRVCDRALHQGYLKRSAVIDADLVRAAIRELGERAPESTADTVADTIPETPRAPVAAAPSAATVSAPAQPDELPDWLTTAGDAVTAAPEVPREHSVEPPPAPPVVQRGGSISLPRSAGKRERRSQPTTYMDQLVRRWWRIGSVVMLLIMVPGVLTLGVSALEKLSESLTEASPPPTLPGEPRLAAPVPFIAPTHPENLLPQASIPGTYTIEVALFETRQGATWLAADLARAGFEAYGEELELPNHGIQYLVAMGPYATRARAEFTLRRLYEGRGDASARLRAN